MYIDQKLKKQDTPSYNKLGKNTMDRRYLR